MNNQLFALLPPKEKGESGKVRDLSEIQKRHQMMISATNNSILWYHFIRRSILQMTIPLYFIKNEKFTSSKSFCINGQISDN